jgi:hypothetical protein
MYEHTWAAPGVCEALTCKGRRFSCGAEVSGSVVSADDGVETGEGSRRPVGFGKQCSTRGWGRQLGDMRKRQRLTLSVSRCEEEMPKRWLRICNSSTIEGASAWPKEWKFRVMP